MEATLLQHTSLAVCATAIRTCWQSHDKSDNGGEKDLELIERIGNKFKHASTLEHLSYTFYIKGISRAVLQELARHRMASPSVKSTRYTLKELKNIDHPIIQQVTKEEENEAESNGVQTAFCSVTNTYYIIDEKTIEQFLVLTDDVASVNISSALALERLRLILRSGVGNDKAKYCLPEAYKTELTWTINARSLQNFLHLRTSKSALWEIVDLANLIYETLPEEHKYLFTDSLEKEE